MTNCGIKNEMNYRNVLQQKFRKSKTTENYEKYKRQKNNVNNLINKQNKTTTKNCWMKTPKMPLHFGEH